jgi:hypothetical protein
MRALSSTADAVQRSGSSYGPEGADLRSAALELLRSSGYAALRGLRCEVTETFLTVTGVVPSYYLKQMAQALLQPLDGLRGVTNLVEVRGIAPIQAVGDHEPSTHSGEGKAGPP